MRSVRCGSSKNWLERGRGSIESGEQDTTLAALIYKPVVASVFMGMAVG